jgi:3-oxoacid CoA-transferase B subunit
MAQEKFVRPDEVMQQKALERKAKLEAIARGKPVLDEQTMALRAAREFQDGMVVNLGIGTPTLCSNYIPAGREVLFHAENGVLGYGEVYSVGEGDPNLINASGQPVKPQPGMSIFDHAESFCMIRGGFIDISVMGAVQVSAKGDMSNWYIPKKKMGTIGGAMDLAFCAKKLIVVMSHVAKDGSYKIVKKCTYPITAPRCVDLIITDIAVIEITPKGPVLKEVAPKWTPEEVQELTEPKLIIAPDLQEIALM